MSRRPLVRTRDEDDRRRVSRGALFCIIGFLAVAVIALLISTCVLADQKNNLCPCPTLAPTLAPTPGPTTPAPTPSPTTAAPTLALTTSEPTAVPTIPSTPPPELKR